MLNGDIGRLADGLEGGIEENGVDSNGLCSNDEMAARMSAHAEGASD